jgi:hypothetical protein
MAEELLHGADFDVLGQQRDGKRIPESMNGEQLKAVRRTLGLSHSQLARVPRFKIAFFEPGDRPLNTDDQERLTPAIRLEATGLSERIAPLTRA